MGFRFRRSISLIPGVRLNLGKKSASFSFGVRGLHYTVGTRGRQITAGIPGSGLSYTHRFTNAPTATPLQQQITAPAAPLPPAPNVLPAGTGALPVRQPRALSINARFAIAGTAVAAGTFLLLGFLSKFFHIG